MSDAVTAGALPILMYHSLDATESVLSVRPEGFAEQMASVNAMGYRAACLRDAIQHLRTSGRWPERTVVLTFDDGYENLHRYARPILEPYGYAATVFLVVDHVGGRNDWAEPPAGLGTQAMLSWSQAEELTQAGWEIGAHTLTHPDLRRLSAAEVEREIRGSRQEIENRLRRPVETFAYPYGHTSAVAFSIAEREFHASCVTELRVATTEALHALPRIDAYYLRNSGDLPRLLGGRLNSYLAIRRWGRRVRAVVSG